jgi:hypothetical protein
MISSISGKANKVEKTKDGEAFSTLYEYVVSVGIVRPREGLDEIGASSCTKVRSGHAGVLN